MNGSEGAGSVLEKAQLALAVDVSAAAAEFLAHHRTHDRGVGEGCPGAFPGIGEASHKSTAHFALLVSHRVGLDGDRAFPVDAGFAKRERIDLTLEVLVLKAVRRGRVE